CRAAPAPVRFSLRPMCREGYAARLGGRGRRSCAAFWRNVIHARASSRLDRGGARGTACYLGRRGRGNLLALRTPARVAGCAIAFAAPPFAGVCGLGLFLFLFAPHARQRALRPAGSARMGESRPQRSAQLRVLSRWTPCDRGPRAALLRG